MQLLVLAAGIGKRFQPLVTSKPLLPFLGKTLLEHVVANCQVLKPSQIIIVVNHKDKVLVAKLFPKAKIVVQPVPNGMAGAIEAARTLLAGQTVIVNGDDWIHPKIIKTFVQQIKTTPNKVILTGIKSQPGLTGGYFSLQGPTLKVIEKPTESKQPSQWLRIVLDYFPKIEAFISVLKSTRSEKDDVYELALNQLTDSLLVKATGKFYQLKYPWQILDLTAGLLTGKSMIDKTAKIFPGAQIINSYIGPKVIVGHHCLIRDSIIEAGTTVGYYTEIARSYVGPNNFFHTNYVGDSIIEGGSNLGSGARLANMRFDKKDILPGKPKLGAILAQGSQLGVNSSVMPGVTLGAKALLGSGLVLYQSLAAGEFKKT